MIYETFCFSTQANRLQHQSNDARRRANDFKSELKSAQSELTDARKEKDDALQAKAMVEQSARRRENALNKLKTEYAALQANVKESNKKCDSVTSRLGSIKERITSIMRDNLPDVPVCEQPSDDLQILDALATNLT